ncbi:hypothetical protein ACQP2K_33950 [Microbispora siamensis]
MLGSAVEAEDAVQDAYLRWNAADPERTSHAAIPSGRDHEECVTRRPSGTTRSRTSRAVVRPSRGT